MSNSFVVMISDMIHNRTQSDASLFKSLTVKYFNANNCTRKFFYMKNPFEERLLQFFLKILENLFKLEILNLIFSFLT